MTDANRTLGEVFGVSIATAQALEAIADGKLSKGYNHVYMNVRTLFRNLHGSYPKDEVPPANKLIDILIEEIALIDSLISQMPGHLIPYFYITTCKSIYGQFPRAKIKEPKTPLQINYSAIERKVTTGVLNKLKEKIKLFDVKISGNNSSTLIITHMPIDLLSANSFRKLSLLESHTGVIKGRSEWITKLTSNEEYRNVPFSALAIQIIGDKNNQFESLGRKITYHLVELAKTHRWTALTTVEKMKFDIRNLKDKYLMTVLLEMCSVTIR